MGDRRMFTKKVTDDDNFMELSASAQALYLHLSMSADDDGFSNQVSVSMFKAHASVQDLQALLEKRYIYQFDNGVIVIKHWRMANALRKDRYTPTVFQEEYAKLKLKDNDSYTMDANWLPSGCQMVATSKDKLSKDKLSKDKLSKFTPPSVEDVREYCESRNNGIDAEEFVAFYDSKNWMIGKDKMTNWKSAVITWEKRRKKEQSKSNSRLVPVEEILKI